MYDKTIVDKKGLIDNHIFLYFFVDYSQYHHIYELLIF